MAAQIDQALSGGTDAVKPGWNYSADGAVAMSLAHAASKGQPYYASLSPIPGEWMTGFMPPKGMAYMEATPDHKVILHLSTGESHEWAQQQVADVVQSWFKAPGQPEPEAKPAAPEPEAKPEPVPQPVWDTAAWKQTPEYQAVHDLIQGHPTGPAAARQQAGH